MGRKRRGRSLPQGVVHILDSMAELKEREPDPPLARAGEFLECMAAEFSRLARLPDSALPPEVACEFAAEVLANRMQDALGEAMTCRILARLGKPRGKPAEKWERPAGVDRGHL